MYRILDEAFRESMYMHSAGSGDVQGIEYLIAQLGNTFDEPDEDQKQYAIAGAICKSAMIDFESAMEFARRIIEGEKTCFYCDDAEADAGEYDGKSICTSCRADMEEVERDEA